MFGDRAFELIKEVERHPDKLLAFDENRLRNIFEEMQALFDQNQRDFATMSSEGNDGLRGAIYTRHEACRWNRQCVLAYVYNRLMQIQDVRWAHGSVLPQDVRLNMTEQEVQYFSNYNKVLANYMRSVGENHGLDLTLDLEPPKSIMIEVKVLEDYGEFETDDGEVIVLKKDSIHYLPRQQSESLVRQGILQPTNSNS